MAKAKAKKSTKKQSVTVSKSKTKAPVKRVLEKPKYKSFRMQKRIKHTTKPILGSFRLFWRSMAHILKHKRLFAGILVVYLILSLILVTGLLGNANLVEIKAALQEVFNGNNGQITTGVALFGVALGNVGRSSSQSGSIYQTILLTNVSLVLIWALRQTYAGEKVKIKDSFYKSMHPLVPFLIVLFVVGLQLIPILAGAALLSIGLGQGLAVTAIEKVLWFLVFAGLLLLSLYMVSSSLFALYIVTLPDLTPMKALRSARELVRYRRWSIMRKVFFLPIVLLLFAGIIMIPVLLYATSVAQWIFVVLSLLSVIVVHAYTYRLYRELL